MADVRDAEAHKLLLELKSVQLELFSLTYRNLHAALAAWQDQVRFLDPRLQDTRSITATHGQVYSQNNEDGIIAEIFRRIGTVNRTFIEFGVGDGLQNNTRLLLELGWKGRWLEGDKTHASAIRRNFAREITEKRLDFVETMVTKDNAKNLATLLSPAESPDFLSVDVDFLTSYVWRELTHIQPRLVCVEYNAHYPPSIAYEVPYAPDQAWQGDTRFGASLKQLENIGRDLGYVLVGCDLMGVNGFFVRKDLVTTDLFMEPFTAEQHYQPPRFSLVHHRGHKSALPQP